MPTRSALAFACAHLSDERLYAHQLAELRATHDCSVFVFRDHDSMAGMAEQVLEAMPERFTLIGLSLGGYVAFEVIRRALPRLERLVLIDTTAVADHPARREARRQDIATVQQGGIEALVPGLPARWLLPAHAANPALAWDVNVTATARLLFELERHGGDPTVLIVGSAEQYGRDASHVMPLAEHAIQAPRTVYAASKAAQEVLALQAWRASGLRVIVARSFNHSGAGQPTRFLLPALVQRALELAAAPVGTPMPVGNRSPVRDFLHVSDVVAGYISLCQRGTPGEAYNVASGTGWSVQQVLEKVLARTGSRAVPTEDPTLVRPVDVPVLIGDPRKLQHATTWRAQRSLDDIIEDLIHAATF
jgi:GDP-4-dehydro-6-deoxy-D-mannose reductase